MTTAVGEVRKYGSRLKSSNWGSRDVFLTGFLVLGVPGGGSTVLIVFLWIVPCYDGRWCML